MKNYFLSYIAEQDIDEIVTYIAQENPTAAYKFLDEIFGAMNLLAAHPDVGHKREDITH